VTTKTTCRACGRPDTVGYWDLKANAPTRVDSPWPKRFYPHARKCVDCGYVDYDATRVRSFSLASLRRAP
jgi:ribosomal protein S14